MADTSVNADINFRLNTNSIRPALSNLQNQLRASAVTIPVNFQVNANTLKDLQTQTGSFQALTSTLNGLSVAAGKANASMAGLGKTITGLGTSINSIGASTTNLRQANTAIASVGNTASTTGKSLSGAAKEAQSFAETIGLSTKRFAAFAVAAGAISTVVFQFSNAVKAAIEFQDQMVKFKQVGNDTQGTIKGVADSIGKLSTTLGVSSKDLSEISVTLRQAQLTASETKIALEAIAKTTVAPTFKNIQNTTEGVIAVLNIFGQGVGKLESQLSSINKVAADFPVEAADIIEAIRRGGAAFKQTGGQLEEFIGLFTAVRSTTRESAETIATSLRTIFARLERPRTISALRSIGVDLQDVKGNAIGGLKAIEQLYNALNKEPPGSIKFAQVVEEIGGIRQFEKVIPLITQFPLAFQAYNTALKGTDSLNKNVETGLESFSRKLMILKESFLDLFRAIAGNTALQSFLNITINAVTGLTSAIKVLEPLIPILASALTIQAATSSVGFISRFKTGLGKRSFAEGGVIPNVNSGIEGRDKVPIYAEPGEFVITKQAAQNIGYKYLYETNESAGTRFAGKPKGMWNAVGGGIIKFGFAGGGKIPTLEEIRAAASTQKGPYGDDKVLLRDAYNTIHKKYPALSFAKFQDIVTSTPEGRSSLGRFDLVGGGGSVGLHPDVLAKSETPYLNTATFHYIRGQSEQASSPSIDKGSRLELIKKISEEVDEEGANKRKAAILEKRKNKTFASKEVALQKRVLSKLDQRKTDEDKALRERSEVRQSRVETPFAKPKARPITQATGVGGNIPTPQPIVQPPIAETYIPPVVKEAKLGSLSSRVRKSQPPEQIQPTVSVPNLLAAKTVNQVRPSGLNSIQSIVSPTSLVNPNGNYQGQPKYYERLTQSLHNRALDVEPSNIHSPTALRQPVRNQYALAPVIPTQNFVSPGFGTSLTPKGNGSVPPTIPPVTSTGLTNVPPFRNVRSQQPDLPIFPQQQRGFTSPVNPNVSSSVNTSINALTPNKPLPGQSAFDFVGFRNNTRNQQGQLAIPGYQGEPINTERLRQALQNRGQDVTPSNVRSFGPARQPVLPSINPPLNPQRASAPPTSRGAGLASESVINAPQKAGSQYIPFDALSQTINEQGIPNARQLRRNPFRRRSSINGSIPLNDFPNNSESYFRQRFNQNVEQGLGLGEDQGFTAQKFADERDFYSKQNARGHFNSAAGITGPQTFFSRQKYQNAGLIGSPTQEQYKTGGSPLQRLLDEGKSREQAQGILQARQGRLKGIATAGALGLAYAAPSILESQLGTAEKPGVFGSGGAKAGSVLGGAITGAATGGFIGAQVGGAPGAVIGAFVGGLTSAVGALQNFNKEIENIKIKEFQKDISNANFNFNKGDFEAPEDRSVFAKSISKLLPSKEEFLDTEAIGSSGIANKNNPSLINKRTPGLFRKALAESLGEERTVALQGHADETVRKVISSNPKKDISKILDDLGEFDTKLGKVDFRTLLGLNPEKFDALKRFAEGQKAAADLQQKANLSIAQTVSEFEKTQDALVKFSQSLESAHKQFSESGNIINNQGSALISGKITGVAATPTVASLGEFGQNIENFGKPGGGFDQNKDVIQTILQRVTNEQTQPGTEEQVRGDQATRALQLFKETDAGQNGPFAETIGKQLKSYIDKQGLKLGDISTQKGLGAVADEILTPQKEIVQSRNTNNATLQKTFEEQQRRTTAQLDTGFELSQRKASVIGQEGQNRIENIDRGAQIQPLTAFGFNRNGSFKQAFSPEELATGRKSGVAEFTRRKQLTALTGLENNTTESLTAGIQGRQGRLAEIESQTQKAVREGAPVQEIERLGKEFSQTQDQIRRFKTGLETIANSTEKLQVVQEEYSQALQKRDADLNARKNIANVATFGTQQQKAEFTRGEILTQQAARLGAQGFQATATEEEKQIVGQHLSQTQGLTRTFENTDKYGRIDRKNPYVNFSGKQIQEFLEKPALDQISGGRGQNELQNNVLGANKELNRLQGERQQAGNALAGLQEGQNKVAGQLNEQAFKDFTVNFNKTVEQQVNGLLNFANTTKELVSALKEFSFPKEISIKRDGVVQVILNGGELLSHVKGDMEKEIIKEIVKQLQDKLPKAIANQPAR